MWEIGTLGNYVLKLIVHIYITLLGGSKDLPARRSLCMQIYSSVVRHSFGKWFGSQLPSALYHFYASL